VILISDTIRGYDSQAARLKAIHQLAKEGFNYFVPFVEVRSKFALQFGIANWVRPGGVHVDGGYPNWHANGRMKGAYRKYPRCARPWVATE